MTPLHFASQKDHLSIIELLAANNAQNQKHENPIMFEFFNAKSDIANFLMCQ